MTLQVVHPSSALIFWIDNRLQNESGFILSLDGDRPPGRNPLAFGYSLLYRTHVENEWLQRDLQAYPKGTVR